MADATTDDFLGSDYDNAYFQGVTVQSPIDRALGLLKDPQTMATLDTLVKEGWKFIRLADDLHEIRSYLNDIRLCFIALTVSGYVGILLYALIMCLKRKKKNNGGGSGGDSGGRYRGGSTPMRQRTGSRFENFDLEAGGGMMTGGGGHDWEDTNTVGMPPPPPPNGTAIRTPDGYRYKPPSVVRRSSGGGGGGVVLGAPGSYPYQQRMNALDVGDVSKSPPPQADTYNAFPTTGVMMSSTSSGSPCQQPPSDGGFIEKVK